MTPQFWNSNSITQTKLYGELFSMMADEVSCIKQRASDLYRDAVEQGIDPAEMDADFSLLELDLATESQVISIAGVPTVEYLDITNICTCEDAEEEE